MTNPISIPAGTSAAGSLGRRSPSNIALVKYWGKRPVQLPQNPSVSFTLSAAYTETRISWTTDSETLGIDALTFRFAGQTNTKFADRLKKYLHSVRADFPFLDQIKMEISSDNSFPHSAGIASSASGMSALVLCLCDIEAEIRRITGREVLPESDFLRRASRFSRLASGSACRSVYDRAAVWGETPDLPGSSDDFALPFGEKLHPFFDDYRDDILIVSAGQKSVSSGAGHTLMENHPYAPARYAAARANLSGMLSALQSGDAERFTQICEAEALDLHALMMTSRPSFVLLEGNSLEIIRKVRDFRQQTGIPLCFTIDAGPNIHLLYPAENAEKAAAFRDAELLPYCAKNNYIADRIGDGGRSVLD